MAAKVLCNDERYNSKVLPEPNGPIGRHWSPFPVALSRTPTEAARDTIRYDTIGEFNVDWKAEYSALSSTRSQKKKLKQPTPVPL